MSGRVVTRARNQHWSKNSATGRPRRGSWRMASRPIANMFPVSWTRPSSRLKGQFSEARPERGGVGLTGRAVRVRPLACPFPLPPSGWLQTLTWSTRSLGVPNRSSQTLRQSPLPELEAPWGAGGSSPASATGRVSGERRDRCELAAPRPGPEWPRDDAPTPPRARKWRDNEGCSPGKIDRGHPFGGPAARGF